MRLIFFGTPQFAVASLQALLGSSHQIVGVVTQPDRPKGRGNQPATPPPIKEAAQAARLPVHQPTDLKEPAFLQTIRSLKPDAAAVVAYGRILPKVLLDLFPKGAFNLHASLLPKYRGAAPIQWSLIRGETEAGVTIFRLDEQLDHGPTVAQAKCRIRPEEDAVTLADSLSTLGSRTLVEMLDQIESGSARLQPQEESLATFAPTLTKKEGILDWTSDCRAIHNRIRGVQPWPGALTWLDGKLLKILSAVADPARSDPSAAPGTIVSADAAKGLWVQTGAGQIRIDRLQMDGGSPLTTDTFLRGHPIQTGTPLTSKA